MYTIKESVPRAGESGNIIIDVEAAPTATTSHHHLMS
jgi:hypothetical protein